MILNILTLILATTIHQAAALEPALSKHEQELVQYIDTHLMTSGMAMLEKTVNINSGTENRLGIQKVGKLYETKLKALGFKTSWIDLKTVGRGHHLFAERAGSKAGLRILLIGHLDTVFEESSPFQKFERVSETRIKGPGIYDMKAGNLIILQALEALFHSNDLSNMNVTVALLGDEEKPGSDPDGSFTTTRQHLIEVAKRSDVALAFEPGVLGIQYATVGRRGLSEWKLKATSKPGHSAKIFSKDAGPGAVFPLAKILGRFYSELRHEKGLTFNAGIIAGGDHLKMEIDGTYSEVSGKFNIIPSIAQTSGDLRFVDAHQLENVRHAMSEIVNEERQALRAEFGTNGNDLVNIEIKFNDLFPAMAPTENNHQLLNLLSQVSTDLMFGKMIPLDPLLRGAGDISFVAPFVKSCLDGLGPLGEGAHSVSETMDATTLPIVAQRAVILLYRLSKDKTRQNLRL